LKSTSRGTTVADIIKGQVISSKETIVGDYIDFEDELGWEGSRVIFMRVKVVSECEIGWVEQPLPIMEPLLVELLVMMESVCWRQDRRLTQVALREFRR